MNFDPRYRARNALVGRAFPDADQQPRRLFVELLDGSGVVLASSWATTDHHWQLPTGHLAAEFGVTVAGLRVFDVPPGSLPAGTVVDMVRSA